MLKYAASVVAATPEHTQNLLRVKTTALLRSIRAYNKRKAVPADDTNALFADIARSLRQLMSIQHADLNLRLRQAGRPPHTLKKNTSSESDSDGDDINIDAADPSDEKEASA